jgi:hypothetical protein
MKDFRQFRKEATKERYIRKEIFQEGDVVLDVNTKQKGKIIRPGVNYVIAVTEKGEMFRAWVTDLREINVNNTK